MSHYTHFPLRKLPFRVNFSCLVSPAAPSCFPTIYSPASLSCANSSLLPALARSSTSLFLCPFRHPHCPTWHSCSLSSLSPIMVFHSKYDFHFHSGSREVATSQMADHHGCQMAIARFLNRLCLYLRASGLWLRYAALQNLIQNGSVPSGNLADHVCRVRWERATHGMHECLVSGTHALSL